MKYRINIFTDVLGVKWYCAESKRGIFSRWMYEDKSISKTLKEATCRKILLENGHSVYDIFKPEYRCELLNLLPC